MSPQSGLPHNNRVGDFDVFALPVILRETGPDARRGPRRPGQPARASRAQRRGPRPPRHRGRGRRRQRRRRRWRSTSSSPRSATTSAPTSSSWAGPTPSSSPAASARTRSAIRDGRLPRPRLVRHRARPGHERRTAQGERTRLGRRLARRRSGPCRRTRRSSSPGRPATCCKRQDVLIRKGDSNVRRPSDRQRGGHPEGGVDDRAQAADRRALPRRREEPRPARPDRAGRSSWSTRWARASARWS